MNNTRIQIGDLVIGAWFATDVTLEVAVVKDTDKLWYHLVRPLGFNSWRHDTELSKLYVGDL